MSQLKPSILEVNDLTKKDVETLYSLMKKYYEGVDEKNFWRI